MKYIIVGAFLLALAGCQSTDSKTTALETAASEEAVLVADSPASTDEKILVSADNDSQSADGTNASGQIVVGDTVVAYRPPPIGTQYSFRFARSGRSVEVFDIVVTSHNGTFKGKKAWVSKSKERITYHDFSYNRLGQELINGQLSREFVTPRIGYQFPMKPRDQWTTTYKERRYAPDRVSNSTEDVTVKSWENVTVPAGKFRTLKLVRKIKSRGRTWTQTNWSAPKLGLTVKGNELWAGSGGNHWTMTKLKLPSGS